MATKLEASRLLVRSAAEKFERGERADVEAGMAKLFCSETAFELATEAMRIHGGYGYTKEFPVERYYRDAPLMIIGEGTNEIQRIVIARGLAGPLGRRPPDLKPCRPNVGAPWRLERPRRPGVRGQDDVVGVVYSKCWTSTINGSL